MLSIGKLARGAGGYYVDSVAEGAEDYYLGAGEAPGRWLGAGAARLGLAGEVDRAGFLAVLNNAHPATGQQLAARSGKVSGFDLTFSAPKSVSLLYAFDETGEVARAVVDAHEAAVTAAVGWIENETRMMRVGKAGAERTEGHGMIVAAFRHRTSRAGDPQLHTHAVVANLAEAISDERWRTINSTTLYAAARTAGFIYQSELRAHLTETLGVEWGDVRNGAAELAAIPDAVVSLFSTRRAEIEAVVGEDASPRAAQAAALDTRRAKTFADRHPDPTLSEAAAKDYLLPGDLAGEWRARLTEAGLTIGPMAELVRPGRFPRPIRPITPEELTAEHATFTSRDLLRLAASHAPEGAHLTQLYTAGSFALGEAESVHLDTEQAPVQQFRAVNGKRVTVDTPATFTTRAQLDLERTMVLTAGRRLTAGVGVASRNTLHQAMTERAGLGVDQAQMVETICREGRGVDVVIGPAGSGKTYALGAARQAWEASGYQVLGAAHAGAAAEQLADGAGMSAAYTIDSLLLRLDRGQLELSPKTVLVVDEAEMAGTRRVAELIERTQKAGAKLVLVGDPAQLPSIDAGGPIAALAARLPHSVLTENRRQRDGWEQEAVRLLRHGQTRVALAAYESQGRINFSPTGEARRAAMLDQWIDMRSQHRTVLLMAGTNADVNALNSLAQTRRLDAGELGGPLVSNPSATFYAGDQLLLRRNDTKLGVRNGNIVTLETSQPRAAAGLYAVRTEGGRRRYLPAEYLADPGSASLGYAVTRHKAQGATVDAALMTDDALLSKEAGYVGMSRGRAENWIFTVTGPEWTDSGPGRRQALDTLAYRLGRSGAKRAAVDVGTPTTPRRSLGAIPMEQVPAEVDARIAQSLNHLAQRAAEARKGRPDRVDINLIQPERDPMADLDRLLAEREQRLQAHQHRERLFPE